MVSATASATSVRRRVAAMAAGAARPASTKPPACTAACQDRVQEASVPGSPTGGSSGNAAAVSPAPQAASASARPRCGVAVPFDDGALFALDGSWLLFTRLLAYRGAEPGAMRAWIRDTYLVAREPGSLHFPSAARLAPATPAPDSRPRAGQLLFDEQRRPVSVSASAHRWLALLAADAAAPDVPLAVQALVGHLAGSGRPAGALTAIDRDGGRVAVRAEPALQLNASGAPRAVTRSAWPPPRSCPASPG
jgi:hypothetical protein